MWQPESDEHSYTETDKQIKKSSPKHMERKPNKERTYKEGLLTVWYKEEHKEGVAFSQIVEGMRLAREMVNKAVDMIPSSGGIVDKILRYHFHVKEEGDKKDVVPSILKSFKYIQNGLSLQVVICVSRDLRPGKRGLTTKSGQIHLNRSILKDSPLAVARTIVHEAAHSYAEMPGEISYKDGRIDEEVYANLTAYLDGDAAEAQGHADRYAWTALSLHQGRLLTPNNFFNEEGIIEDVDAY